MLRGIDPVISPDLLDVLFRMGHGDELVLADAFFPGDSLGDFVVRADGIGIPRLLKGILPLITLDTFAPPLAMMQPVDPADLDPAVEAAYRAEIDAVWPDTPPVERVERFAFYERAQKAYAVLMTGETAKYGNLIIKKGVIDR